MNFEKGTSRTSIKGKNTPNDDDYAEQQTTLMLTIKELGLEKKEKNKRGAQLKTANKELRISSNEKVKRARELAVKIKELVFLHREKDKRQKELQSINRKLSLQCGYLKKCSADLRLANRNLLKENKAKDKHAKELLIANDALILGDKNQSIHIAGLGKMMYILSHKLRQPVVQILGLTSLLTTEKNTSPETTEVTDLIKESAEFLDGYTRELTDLIHYHEIHLSNDKQEA